LRPLVNPNARVKFLGAFDTVAGSDWDEKCLFSKVRFQSLHLDRCVDAAVQILAIDDNKNPSFSPLLWDRPSKFRTDQELGQIWMPGVHSDIGGSSDGRFLGNVALLTMVDRAKKHSLTLYFGTERPVDLDDFSRRNSPALRMTTTAR
jgi:Uncharacterized alpha/beta hydrolase domain (DUF2235)